MKKWTLEQYVHLFKAHAPLKKSVILRVKTLPDGDLGHAKETNKRFIITIESNQPLWIQKESLMEEWAHCLAGWDGDRQHTSEWGIEYARLKRIVFDEKE
jgi:hypothetical protein